MDLILYRQDFTPTGIYGKMGDFYTLEHAYPGQPTGWVPKVPPGSYVCVLGHHRLHGMDTDFLTYEVTGVPNCTGILFHWGNWNKDSEGCILLGMKKEGDMIVQSKMAFTLFMALQANTPQFTLTVV